MNKSILLTALLVILWLGSCTPAFDSGTPDTENNKYHFEQLLGIKASKDVQKLYSHGDQMGIDASYYLAFECNKETATRIIQANSMAQDSAKGIPLSNGLKIDWWNEKEIKSLSRYVYRNESGTYFKYFWYNEDNQHAYFLDFDL